MKNSAAPCGTIKWIAMGMFPSSFLLCAGFTYDELMRKLDCLESGSPDWAAGLREDRELLEQQGAYAYALRRHIVSGSGEKDTLYYIVITGQFTFSDEDMVTLAHEALHLCQYYLPRVLDRDKEPEGEAYLHSFIMSRCLEHLREVSRPIQSLTKKTFLEWLQKPILT